MKTELIYPNGLKVTIEFEDVALLEVLESNPAADLIKRVAELEKENHSMKEQIDELNQQGFMIINRGSEVPSDAMPGGGVGPLHIEEEKYMHDLDAKRDEETQLPSDEKEVGKETTVTAGVNYTFTNNPKRPDPVHLKEKNPGKHSKFVKRKCHWCGQMFEPTGPRGFKCETCKAKEIIRQPKKPSSELDKTLAEIEANKKKPYEFLEGGTQ